MEKYMKILEEIEKNDISIIKLLLLDCLDKNIEQMNYCYDFWLDTDVDIALTRLADIVKDNWKEIQNDEMTDDDILDMILDI